MTQSRRPSSDASIVVVSESYVASQCIDLVA